MSEPATDEDLRQFRGQLEQIIKTAIDVGIYNEDWLDGCQST